jgi:hypothetical protein
MPPDVPREGEAAVEQLFLARFDSLATSRSSGAARSHRSLEGQIKAQGSSTTGATTDRRPQS